MDTIIHATNAVLDLFRSGFNQVNAVLGLIIALVASFQLLAWKKLWEMALAALAFHIVALMLAPAIDHGAAIRLPALMEPSTWRNWLAIYVGYVILITLFYFLRTRLLKPAAAHH
jgi:hypothetical protein